MKQFWSNFVVFSLLWPVSAQSQERPNTIAAGQPAAPAVGNLPIKEVVLYKNGVGYFEHTGPVRDQQDVTISFTSGQLNDVLKSLTVLDLNGGRITGVGYGSASPVDRQLGDLRLPVSEKTSLSEFLGALRGARIEVRSGPSVITGRLLSIERKTRTGGGTTLEVDYLALITDNGEVKTTELTPAFSVRLLERGLPGKVDRYFKCDRLRPRSGRTAHVDFPPTELGPAHYLSATSARFRSGKPLIESCSIPRPASCRFCKAGRSSITRWGRIGKTCNCRWWLARLNPSFRISRSPIIRGGPWCRCRRA